VRITKPRNALPKKASILFAAHARMDVQTRHEMSSSLPTHIPAPTANRTSRSILTPSVTSIMVETPLQKQNLENYIQKDISYQVVLNKQRQAHIQLAKEKKREIELYNIEKQDRHHFRGHFFGPGYRAPGNAPSIGPSHILYPIQKRKRSKSSEFRL
jgi:hypothetical protein